MSEPKLSIEEVFAEARKGLLCCPTCGTMDPKQLSLVYDVTCTVGILSIDQNEKFLAVDVDADSDEYDWRESRIFCRSCNDEFVFPHDWRWE